MLEFHTFNDPAAAKIKGRKFHTFATRMTRINGNTMQIVDLTLQLTLHDIESRVWRRATVSSDFILSDLHQDVQH